MIQNVKKVNKNKTIFTYEEICSLLSKYIIDQKDQFLHVQNIKIAWVQNDPLGRAFNMLVFHKGQVGALLWSQLIPVKTRKSPRLFNW